jgi:hypothetical protein
MNKRKKNPMIPLSPMSALMVYGITMPELTSEATVPGYNIAALAVFGIPWGLGTVIGLATRAIHGNGTCQSHEQKEKESNDTFVSDECFDGIWHHHARADFSMIAVSSILSYDIYKTYLNPKATDKQIVGVSHLTVVIMNKRKKNPMIPLSPMSALMVYGITMPELTSVAVSKLGYHWILFPFVHGSDKYRFLLNDRCQ